MSVEAKIYNALQRNRIEPCKKPRGNTIIRRLFQGIDSIHRVEIEQLFLAYGFPKETVEAIMMLYKNMKVNARLSDGDTHYFDILAGVLQGDTLTPYLFIICLDYVLRTSVN